MDGAANSASGHLGPPIAGDDRVRLIGQLICKGILCSPGLRRDRPAVSDGAEEPIPAPEGRIVDYLRRHQAASPSEMRTVLNLSRSSTYRALQNLLLSRRVVANGCRTSAAAYRLADFDPSRN